ncbi:MAG TPA: glycosyltransferase family 4 protein [Candidatus Saccharimonadales bacterium]|nr:glycosyltransferase family 4 protein [Candidatus Saccharimonadales bacterium]
MKILIVSSYLPYPLYSGGHIRLFNIIKRLSKKHEITLVCEKRDYQTAEDRQEVEKICKRVITVSRKKQWSLKNILKSASSLHSFLITGHTSTEMKEKIVELLGETQFDLIHVETSYVMQNVPKTFLPIVLVEHNVEYLVYKRFAEKSGVYLRPLLYADIVKLAKEEKAFWKRATKLVAVSEREKEIMHADGVVPNGVDTQKFKVKSLKLKVEKKEKRILFIGDFKWIQNRDSARFIIRDVWPKVSKYEKIKLWIVGRDIPDDMKSLGDKNIIFDENASDTAQIFQKAFALLSPIRVGGGTSYKILEAMASGVPVITTDLGIEGLEVSDKKDILVADTAEEFARSLENLLKDKTLYETVAKNAREIVEKEYNWDTIVEKLEGVYDSAVKEEL